MYLSKSIVHRLKKIVVVELVKIDALGLICICMYFDSQLPALTAHPLRATLCRGAGLCMYLTEVSNGKIHACQLFPYGFCQIQTKRASSPDCNAQKHSCKHTHK